MGDIDCGGCDCGNCDCDCNCGDCDCDCCDGDGGCCSGDNNHPLDCCSNLSCGVCVWGCCSNTAVDTAVDVDHVVTSYQKRRKEQQEKYLLENGNVESTPSTLQGYHVPDSSGTESNGGPVMTQPGSDPDVVVSQPRGDPPPYSSVVEQPPDQ